jgi:hypothetical protein
MIPWFEVDIGSEFPAWLLRILRVLKIRRKETERCWTCNRVRRACELSWGNSMEPICEECKAR